MSALPIGTAPAGDPHAGARVLRWGPPPGEAPLAMVLLHGRGDSAAGILGLADALADRGAPPMTVLAPDAVGAQWYPRRFVEPVAANEPWLTSALGLVERCVAALEAHGVDRRHIVVAGFSQGACLASEAVARAGGAWGGVVALSGGLIGETVDPARYPTRLDGTSAFFGCSDVDAHIPEARVRDSARQVASLGADVVTRIYPGMPHTVNEDELDWLVAHLRRLAAASA